MLEEQKPEYWAHFDPPHTVPSADGWYPAIRVFDLEECGIPDAGQWCAGIWTTWRDPCVMAFGPRHETESGALKAAVENDPWW